MIGAYGLYQNDCIEDFEDLPFSYVENDIPYFNTSYCNEFKENVFENNYIMFKEGINNTNFNCKAYVPEVVPINQEPIVKASPSESVVLTPCENSNDEPIICDLSKKVVDEMTYYQEILNNHLTKSELYQVSLNLFKLSCLNI